MICHDHEDGRHYGRHKYILGQLLVEEIYHQFGSICHKIYEVCGFFVQKPWLSLGHFIYLREVKWLFYRPTGEHNTWQYDAHLYQVLKNILAKFLVEESYHQLGLKYKICEVCSFFVQVISRQNYLPTGGQLDYCFIGRTSLFQAFI